MSYRDETATLRAEVERLRREAASERGQRWAVQWGVGAEMSLFAVLAVNAGWAAAFVVHGVTPTTQRGSLVVAVVTIVWALAFVRRVPVAGGGR